MKDDKVYYIDCDNAIVTNIEIKSNSDLIKTTGAPYYDQLKKYFKAEQKSYKEVIDHLDGTSNWSDDLKYYHKKMTDILNEEILFENSPIVPEIAKKYLNTLEYINEKQQTTLREDNRRWFYPIQNNNRKYFGRSIWKYFQR
jgi:hypothetical protein